MFAANNKIIRVGSRNAFLIECRASFRCNEFTEMHPPKFIARDNAFDIVITDLQKGNWDFGLEVEEFRRISHSMIKVYFLVCKMKYSTNVINK